MTTDNYKKSAFPVGYHDFHKDQGFNFQLNRWYSMGYISFEDLKEAGQNLQNRIPQRPEGGYQRSGTIFSKGSE